MPGLSGRMSTVVKAKVSSLLDRAEDPAETLDYSYEEQLEQLQSVKQDIVELVTARSGYRIRNQASRSRSPGLLARRVRRGCRPGGLGTRGAERKHLAEGEMQSLDQQVAQLEDQQQKLTDSEQKLRVKVEAFPAGTRSSRRSTRLPRRRCHSGLRRAWARRWPTSGGDAARAR